MDCDPGVPSRLFEICQSGQFLSHFHLMRTVGVWARIMVAHFDLKVHGVISIAHGVENVKPVALKSMQFDDWGLKKSH